MANLPYSSDHDQSDNRKLNEETSVSESIWATKRSRLGYKPVPSLPQYKKVKRGLAFHQINASESEHDNYL